MPISYEKCMNIVLLVAFILFNCSFWMEKWSKSKNESQGLYEWCVDTDGTRCCQTVSERDIYTQGNGQFPFFYNHSFCY